MCNMALFVDTRTPFSLLGFVLTPTPDSKSLKQTSAIASTCDDCSVNSGRVSQHPSWPGRHTPAVFTDEHICVNGDSSVYFLNKPNLPTGHFWYCNKNNKIQRTKKYCQSKTRTSVTSLKVDLHLPTQNIIILTQLNTNLMSQCNKEV